MSELKWFEADNRQHVNNAKSQGTGGEEKMTQNPAWLLIVAGPVIVGIGLVWLLAPSIPWLGNLPGDIRIEGENFRFYFPIVTCILISLVLTGTMWLLRILSR